jgi:hypothetical protein
MKGTAMPRDFFPRPDAEALSYTANFSARLSADPELYHVSPETAAQYAQLHLAFAQAYRVTANRATRNMAATSAKRAARKKVEFMTRRIAAAISACRDITLAQKTLIGVKVRSRPTRIGKPKLPPHLSVRGVVGRTVTIDLIDNDGSIRRKPKHVTQAIIFIYVGDQPPGPGEQWVSKCISSRTRVKVTFGPATPPGAKVWVTACWTTAKGLRSPCATPVSAYVGYAIALPVLRAA